MERFKRILKFVGLILLAMSINIFPMLLIGQEANTAISMKWLLSLAYLLLAGLIIWKIWSRYAELEHYTVTMQRFTWKDFGIALLFFLATRVLAIAGTLLVQQVTGNQTSANDAALMATNEQAQQMFPLYFIAFHVAIGVFAPILEELVFRGYFSLYFFKKGNKWVKLAISSLIFALLHIVYPIEFLIYFPLGAIFYLAFSRRGNIRDAIAVHLLNNSLIVVFSVIQYLVLILG